MRRFEFLVAVMLAATCLRAEAQQIVHRERLVPKPTVAAMANGKSAAASVATKPDVRALDGLAFDAFGRRFDLALEPNRMLAAAATRAGIGTDVGVYRGRIDGVAGSWVRLVVGDQETRGLFSDGNEIYAVDMLPDPTGNALAPYVFRLADLIVAPGMLGCSAGDEFATGAAVVQALVDETAPLIQSAAGATATIDLAVIADYELSSSLGAGTDAALLARINNVDGIFSSELGVEITVSRVDTFATSADPFSGATDSAALLGELADYRLATPAQSSAGLTHLFTGRNLDGTTVGIAYTDALCHPHYGAGLTEATHGTTIDSLITAHEIGHNFGAPHDGETGSACASEPQTFLMAPSINGSDQFSACSISEMQARIATAGCIQPLTGTDIAVSAVAKQPILLGDTTTLVFDVDNVGAGSVGGTVVDVSLPPNAGLVNAATPNGTCTTGAGTASCSLPAIGAGAGTTVSLTVAPTAPGDLDFAAVATASGDANAANDSDTLRLTTNPAIDLAAVAAASTAVTLNANVAVSPTIENHSAIAATTVTVTVTPSAGIDVVDASWAAGTCTISANAAICTAASIAPQATTTLSLTLEGTTEGGHSYVVQATAAEIDRVTANNSVSGQVSVNAPSSTGSASGGGAFGLPSLLLLMLAGLVQRRPAPRSQQPSAAVRGRKQGRR